MLGKNNLVRTFISALLTFAFPMLTSSQTKGLIFDDVAFKNNVRKQYLGPAFQDDDLPEKVSLKAYCPEAGDQGNIGSCVGWAVGYGAYTISDAIRNNRTDGNEITSNAYSALYLFNQIKISDCSNGAFIDKTLTFAKQKGDCFAKAFQPDNCLEQPNPALPTLKIQDFQALFYGNEDPEVRLYAVKQKLNGKIPVIIGFETNSKFSPEFITKNNPVWSSGGRNYGGHAVVIVGYDDRKEIFEVLNSWGRKFGEDGCFYMRYNDFLTYTHYAAALILPVKNLDVPTDFKGSSIVRYYDKSQKRMEDVNIVKLNDYGYSPAKDDWSKGDIFQVVITNKTQNQYIYVFSINDLAKPTIHFPRRSQFGNVRPGDESTINESDFFTSAMNEIFVPNQKTGLQMNSSKEVLCILYAKSEIKDFLKVVNQIAENYDRTNNLAASLKTVLGDRIQASTDIQYSSNTLSFDTKVIAKTIVPIIIQFKAMEEKRN